MSDRTELEIALLRIEELEAGLRMLIEHAWAYSYISASLDEKQEVKQARERMNLSLNSVEMISLGRKGKQP